MSRLTHLLTTARAEGGAVRISFGMPAGFPHVRVLRTPTGVPVTDPNDTAAHLVWDGPPQQGEPSFRFARNLDTADRGQIWDIQAFADQFNDRVNLIDDQSWDYHLWPRSGATFGQVSRVTVRPRRTVNTYLTLNIKDLVYQRGRYHAAPRGVAVIKHQALQGHAPPLLQIAERYVLTHIHIGSEDREGGGESQMATLRGIAEARLIARTPAERDELGEYFMLRFWGDLGLFGELGWDELGLNARDSMVDLVDAMYYAREITLDGIVDAYLDRNAEIGLGNVRFAWRVPL